MTRLRSRLLPALVAAALLAGCAGLPDRGPVAVEQPAEPGGSTAPFDFNPPGPAPDASREQVVAGFLRALQATPSGTATAEEFLTDEAAARWSPDRATVVYSQTRTRSAGSTVTVVLDDAFSLDGRGRFTGALTGTRREIAFPVVREAGQWRIDGVPDALVVPRSYFATRYRPYLLHFFDPSGAVLVPERVHLPWGKQLPTRLVDGLLAGPPTGAGEVARSFFPGDLRLDVSVPVRPGGVAEVRLAGEVGTENRPRMLAQLAWTLRGVSDVDALQLIEDGEVPAGPDEVAVTGFEGYSPTVSAATDRLFAVRGSTVVEVDGSEEEPAGTGAVPALRALAATLVGDRFAAVTADGRRVLAVEEDQPPRTVLTGSDVRAVAFDRTGRLWIVDQRAARPVVTVVAADAADAEPVRIALSGTRGVVVDAALSRDGSRLALLVQTSGGAQLRVSRVQRDAAGAPVGLTASQPLPTAQPLTRARAVGWRDAETLAVLTRPSATTSGVVLAATDGSSAAVRGEPTVDTLFAPGARLATDPGPSAQLVVTTEDGQLHRLDAQGRWGREPTFDGLRAVTFAG